MGERLVRVDYEGVFRFGRVRDESIELFTENHSLLQGFFANLHTLAEWDVKEIIPLPEAKLHSPVTPFNLYCQGKNYTDHIIEMGGIPEEKTFNLFFMKAVSSLTGPFGPVICPPHVKLLDYEAEMALVIRNTIPEGSIVSLSNLSHFVAGIVLTNDISARDVQIPQNQWFKGKSYRTFCPAGPYFLPLGETEWKRIGELELSLEVNGGIRQKARLNQMIYSIEETLTEMASLVDLAPGDLILTGTPSGVAMKIPPGRIKHLVAFLRGEKKLMDLFLKSQSEIPNYLHPGDIVRAHLRTPDGLIDAGTQTFMIQAAKS